MIFPEFDRLTTREREVLFHLAYHGGTSEELAERLGIATNTLRTHRDHILRMLGVTNTARLVALAWRSGFVEDYLDRGEWLKSA